MWQNNGGIADEIQIQENQWAVNISKKNKNDKVLFEI